MRMSEIGFEIDLPERRAKIRNSWLGILGACALVWYMLGLFALVMTFGMNAEMARSIYSSEQLQYLSQTPGWAKFFNSAALCSGLIGSGYILLRKANAYKWYMLSLICTLILMLDAVFRDGFRIMDSTHFGVSVIGMVIGVYLFWATYSAKNKGELRTT